MSQPPALRTLPVHQENEIESFGIQREDFSIEDLEPNVFSSRANSETREQIGSSKYTLNELSTLASLQASFQTTTPVENMLLSPCHHDATKDNQVNEVGEEEKPSSGFHGFTASGQKQAAKGLTLKSDIQGFPQQANDSQAPLGQLQGQGKAINRSMQSFGRLDIAGLNQLQSWLSTTPAGAATTEDPNSHQTQSMVNAYAQCKQQLVLLQQMERNLMQQFYYQQRMTHIVQNQLQEQQQQTLQPQHHLNPLQLRTLNLQQQQQHQKKHLQQETLQQQLQRQQQPQELLKAQQLFQQPPQPHLQPQRLLHQEPLQKMQVPQQLEEEQVIPLAHDTKVLRTFPPRLSLLPCSGSLQELGTDNSKQYQQEATFHVQVNDHVASAAMPSQLSSVLGCEDGKADKKASLLEPSLNIEGATVEAEVVVSKRCKTSPDPSVGSKHTNQSSLRDNIDARLPKRQRRKYTHEPFPCKLHRMLLDMEQLGQNDVAGFTGSGEAFQIHKLSAFTKEFIPKYFRHSKFSSFRRQLGMYGFQRYWGGPETGAFSHPLFRRDNAELCHQIVRLEDREERDQDIEADKSGI